MIHQLRTYTIQPGAMDDWIELLRLIFGLLTDGLACTSSALG